AGKKKKSGVKEAGGVGPRAFFIPQTRGKDPPARADERGARPESAGRPRRPWRKRGAPRRKEPIPVGSGPVLFARLTTVLPVLGWPGQGGGYRRQTKMAEIGIADAPPRSRVWDTLRLVASSGGPGRCEFALNNVCKSNCRFCNFARDTLPKERWEYVDRQGAFDAIDILFRQG